MISIEASGRQTIIHISGAGAYLQPHEVVELAKKLLERYMEIIKT